MSWLFSRALVEASSAGICSAGGQSAPSSTTPTPQAFLWRDKTTAAWRRFPSGMTCEPLTGDRGEELLTSYRAAFRAKTSAPQERAPESMASKAASGAKWHGSLAKYARASRSWKTRQGLLHGGLAEFSETWPRWGTTRGGVACQQETPRSLQDVRRSITSAVGCGLSEQVPTPTVCGNYNRKGASKTSGDGLATYVKNMLAIGGQLSPPWVEWLMGWPIGWTDLSALETDKFQQWRRSHGDC